MCTEMCGKFHLKFWDKINLNLWLILKLYETPPWALKRALDPGRMYFALEAHIFHRKFLRIILKFPEGDKILSSPGLKYEVATRAYHCTAFHVARKLKRYTRTMKGLNGM